MITMFSFSKTKARGKMLQMLLYLMIFVLALLDWFIGIPEVLCASNL